MSKCAINFNHVDIKLHFTMLISMRMKKDKYKWNGCKILYRLLLQPLLLVWALINLMLDLWYIILCPNRWRIIIRRAEEQEEMENLLNVYYFIEREIKFHCRAWLWRIRYQKMRIKIFVWSSFRIWLNIVKISTRVEENSNYNI